MSAELLVKSMLWMAEWYKGDIRHLLVNLPRQIYLPRGKYFFALRQIKFAAADWLISVYYIHYQKLEFDYVAGQNSSKFPTIST